MFALREMRGGNAAMVVESRDTGLFLCILESTLIFLFHLNRFLSFFVPPSIMKALYMLSGYTAYYSLFPVRKRLDGKIADAMPGITRRREISRIGRRACCALLMPSLELILLKRHGRAYMQGLHVEGIQHLEKADGTGKGVILAGIHQGANATRIAVMSRLGKEYTPIFLYPGDSEVAGYYMSMLRFGQGLGCDEEDPVFWTGQDAVRKVREHLGRGKRVGIDIDVPGRCVVDFFGRPAALADGIARFAIATGAAIVPFQLLQGRKALEHRLVIHAPIDIAMSGDLDDDIRAIMGAVAWSAERMIEDDPGQWMSWFGIRGLWRQYETVERGIR